MSGRNRATAGSGELAKHAALGRHPARSSTIPAGTPIAPVIVAGVDVAPLATAANIAGRGKAPARPQRAQLDSQVLRELQKALAITRCIRLAAEYGEDDALDFADALAGLLILIEGAAALLDQQEVSP